MRILKSKTLTRIWSFLLVGVIVGITALSVGSNGAVYADTEEKKSKSGFDTHTENLYWQNDIYFYNPLEDGENEDCIPRDGGAGLPSGNSRVEKIWRYIMGLGISGISDNAAAIAGIVGNMSVETGGTFNPFVQNSGGCTGLIQWCRGGYNNGFFSYMEEKGLDDYYYRGSEPNIGESIIDKGIEAELNFLFKDGSGGVTANNYKSNINAPQNKNGASGARAYADLFLVTVENAYGGSDTIEDPGVRGIARHSTYQAASSRRSRAGELYEQFKDLTGDDEEEDEEGDGEEDEDLPYCDEDEDEEDEEGDGDYEDPKAGDLASYVKAWAWPDYHAPKFTERMRAYADYMDNTATYRPCNGVDCGAFVSNIIRASGWDPSYPLGNTSTQSSWLQSNWNKVSDTSRLRLGDVGMKKGGGHVILYVGSIPGFNSKTASASDCRGRSARAPTAGRESDASIQNNYIWYRKR